MRRFAVICFACAAGLFAAGTAHARSSCWEQVISDWSAHNRIKGNYSAGCYRQALQTRLTKSPVAAPKAANTAANTDGGNNNRQLLLFGAIATTATRIAPKSRSCRLLLPPSALASLFAVLAIAVVAIR